MEIFEKAVQQARFTVKGSVNAMGLDCDDFVLEKKRAQQTSGYCADVSVFCKQRNDFCRNKECCASEAFLHAAVPLALG